jgi:hypothetical protein
LKKEQQTILEKYFKEKYTSGMKCELVNEVSNSIGKGVNKTVNERLQTKWLNGQVQVRMC